MYGSKFGGVCKGRNVWMCESMIGQIWSDMIGESWSNMVVYDRRDMIGYGRDNIVILKSMVGEICRIC